MSDPSLPDPPELPTPVPDEEPHEPDAAELAWDRSRRLWMKLALLVVAFCGAMSGIGIGQLLGLVAGLPLGLAIQLAEMRQVAPEEFQLFTVELPGFRIAELVVWLGLTGAAIFLAPQALGWIPAGAWLYDAHSYYRHRANRVDRLYALAVAINQYCEFSTPWLYPVPLLLWGLAQ